MGFRYLTLVAALIGLGGCASYESSSSNRSVDELMAAAESDNGEADPAKVRYIDGQLDALRKKCTDTRKRLASYGEFGRDDPKKHGITEAPSLVLHEMNRSIPPGYQRESCSGILAGYLVIRENGG